MSNFTEELSLPVAAIAAVSESDAAPLTPAPSADTEHVQQLIIQQAIAQTQERGDTADAGRQRAILFNQFGRVMLYPLGLFAGSATANIWLDANNAMKLSGAIAAGAVTRWIKDYKAIPRGLYLPESAMPPAVRLEIYRLDPTNEEPQGQSTLLWARLPRLGKNVPAETRTKLFREALIKTGEKLAAVSFDSIAISSQFMQESGLLISGLGRQIDTADFFTTVKGIPPYQEDISAEEQLTLFSKKQFERLIELQDSSLLLQLLTSLANRWPQGMVATILNSEAGLSGESKEKMATTLKAIINRCFIAETDMDMQRSISPLPGAPKKFKQGLHAELREENGNLYICWLNDCNLFVSRQSLFQHLDLPDLENLLEVNFERLPSRQKDLYEAFAAFMLLKFVDSSGSELPPLTDEERTQYNNALVRRRRVLFNLFSAHTSKYERLGYVSKLRKSAAIGAMLFMIWVSAPTAIDKASDYFSEDKTEDVTPVREAPATQNQSSKSPVQEKSEPAETPPAIEEFREELQAAMRILIGITAIMGTASAFYARNFIHYEAARRKQIKVLEKLKEKDLGENFALLEWVSFGHPVGSSFNPNHKPNLSQKAWLSDIETRLSYDGANSYLAAPHLFDSTDGRRVSWSERQTNLILANYVRRAHILRGLEKKLGFDK